MKKLKQKARQRRRKPNASQLKRQRNRVLDLTAQGKNRAVVAATLGVGVNRLREGFALELDAGREQAKAARAEEAADEALSLEEYHFLDVVTDVFPATGLTKPTAEIFCFAALTARVLALSRMLLRHGSNAVGVITAGPQYPF